MARHDNRDRVGAICQTDGATRPGSAELLGQLAIAGRLPWPDHAESCPNLPLKFGPASSYGDLVETADHASKVGVEGICDRRWRGGGTKLVAPILAPEQAMEARLAISKIERAQLLAFVPGQQHLSEWRRAVGELQQHR